MLRTNLMINHLKQISSILTMAAILLTFVPATAQAASTGIALTPSAVTTPVNVQVNFQATVEKTGQPSHDYITVSDSASGGSFFDSNGTCSNTTPDADNKFAIQNNKNVCYSNSAAGVYSIAVQLFDVNGAPIGTSKTVSITVEAEASNPNTEVSICHASNSHTNPYNSQTPADASQIVSGHDDHNGPIWFSGIEVSWGDIIPTFTWYEKVGNGQNAVWEARQYPGKNWTTEGQAIWNNECGIPANEADLSITKSVNSTTPFEGTNVTYTITVTNNGPMTATSLSVTDPLAVGLSYVSSSISPALTSPLTWNIPTLANGGSWAVDVVAAVGADQGGLSITNTATVSGTPTDPSTRNNTDSETINPRDVVNVVPGCTDTDAKNFNNEATTDDQSCLYELVVNKVIIGETKATPNQFSFTVNGATTTAFDENGKATLLVTDGSYTITEVVAPGFSTSYDNCAPATISGTTTTCTITNTVVVGEPVVCEIGENLLQNGSFEDPVIAGPWAPSAIANWVVTKVSDSSSTLGEIWRGLGIGASDGLQNVELDSAESTQISQTVATIPGATYELRFDFAARSADLVNNNVDAVVDGVVVESANSVNTNWTTYGATFVADASTDVVLRDMGTSDSYGSLVDNAVLCLVREPAPVQACELTVVSNITNTVAGNPAALAWVHPNWVDGIVDSVAQWIWGTEYVVDPSVEETQTFTKTFNWNGPVTVADLEIATDNSYVVSVNGVEFGGDAGEDNFSAVDQHDLTAFLQTNIISGVNTLEIEVLNMAADTTNREANPAGLIYDLNIVGNTTVDCKVVPEEEEEEVTSCTLTASDTSFRRGGDTTLTWNILNIFDEYVDAVITNSVDTEEVGVDTEEGSHEEENINEDTTYTLTVFGKYLEDESQEREVLATCSVDIDTTTGGGRGSSRSRVLGLSTTPQPLVLGEQVSIVPTGAPDTGHGGTAPQQTVLGLSNVLYIRREE